MQRKLLFSSLFFICYTSSFSQQNYPSDPYQAQFITTDIINFWKAFDMLAEKSSSNPFQEHYIKIGSNGVRDFIPDRIKSADSLLNKVKQKKQDYQEARENTFKILEKEMQTRATFYALKHWYPQAIFPPVYFVIGRFNSGGTSSESGLIIGAEKVAPEIVPNTVAHELIHFQQNYIYQDSSLLEACIMEGSPDFIGELISGDHGDHEAFKYGNANRKELWKEFQQIMHTQNFSDWLYGTSGKDKRPADLGYWIGYEITKAYFDKAVDKKQAVFDILNIKDFKAFYMKSGYSGQ